MHVYTKTYKTLQMDVKTPPYMECISIPYDQKLDFSLSCMMPLDTSYSVSQK